MMVGVEAVVPRMVSRATESNRGGRSISSSVRPLIQDQLYPCRPPEKVKWMRLASVFAGQTRTNQPSCAAAPARGPPTSRAMRDARKNARICPPVLLRHIGYVGRKPEQRQPDHRQHNRKTARAVSTRRVAGASCCAG